MKTNANKQLEELYLSKWKQLSDALLSFNEETEEEEPGENENMATHPLLIKAGEVYEKAGLKIMFFGQETNQWNSEFNNGIFNDESNIEDLLSRYETFYLNKGYERYGKPFWNFIKRIQFNDSTSHAGYIWNNILKVGKYSSGTPQQGLIKHLKDYFNVITNEIEILKPDVLLFFTGPKYDQYIERFVGKYTANQIDGFKINELCRLNFSSMPAVLALRTYHPMALQYRGKAQSDRVFNSIVKLLSSRHIQPKHTISK